MQVLGCGFLALLSDFPGPAAGHAWGVGSTGTGERSAMTRHKHLKQLVRDRMAKTGQRYTAARRWILGNHNSNAPHLPGLVPATTALRVLLTHAGLRDPHTGRPFTEAMLYGLAGGVGIGVCSFYYEKEDFASFFVAGRHLWHDESLYLQRACKRLGATTVVKETSSPKAAEKNLREMLAAHGPCVAWVDMAGLPHRGVTITAGYAYHVITVYSIDEANQTASIGDLTDEPITISLAELTAARGRIRKDKYRLLAVTKAPAVRELAPAVTAGLKACHVGLKGSDAPANARKMFSLDAVQQWADRLTSTKDNERWERVFAAGHKLWAGLTGIHRYVEYYNNGGGLGRPVMADFLAKAADSLGQPALKPLGDRYAELGKQWADLADAALPDEIPEFAEFKSLTQQYAELYNSGGTPGEKRAVWDQMDELGRRVKARFPLTPAECAELRASLAERVRAIHAAEVAAHQQLTDSAI